MTPLAETVLIVVIALVVLLFVFWLFGMFRTHKTEVGQPQIIEYDPQALKETSKPEILPYKVFVAPDIKQGKKGKEEIFYFKTGKFFKFKEDYYELISSSTGSLFYIKDEQRKYLTAKEKELPTYSKESILG